MAFNPFVTFQKNQKFWMAAILLLCMITFVFCTGLGGSDLGERLIYWLKKRGPTLVALNGQNLTYEDFARLRVQRRMVNEFMRQCADVAVKDITQKMQEFAKQPAGNDPKKVEERKKVLTELSAYQLSLIERLRKPRFFDGGDKFDELIDFKVWQTQADRLGINLLEEDVDLMVRMEFFSPKYDFISYEQLQRAEYAARQGNQNESHQSLRKALREEYRVRLAQLALYEMQASNFYQNRAMPFVDPALPTQQRAQITLAQLWKVYQEKRAEFDVTLIPIPVADFKGEISDPGNVELQKLFDRYRTQPYDPTNPSPSYQEPPEVKAEFIMADPTSPAYAGLARARFLVEAVSPLAWNPMQSPVLVAARYGGAVAAEKVRLEEVLKGLSQGKALDLYGAAELGAPHYLWPLAAHLAARDPAAIAGAVGKVPAGLAAPGLAGVPAFSGMLAQAMVRHPAALEAAQAAEEKRRLLPYATIAASAASGQPFDIVTAALVSLKAHYENDAPFGAAPQLTVRTEPQLLPLPVLEADLSKVLESQMAEKWASRNLLAVKAELDKSTKPEAIKRVLKEAIPKYALTHVVTGQEKGSRAFYSRYDIDQAPELKPLKDSFEKYVGVINLFEKRDLTPERLLKETDFHKLFFDNEPFASTVKYQVRAWPPEIHPSTLQVQSMPGLGMLTPQKLPAGLPEGLAADIQRFAQEQDSGKGGYRLLDKAQKPILFWRADEKPAAFPPDLAKAHDRVLDAYKTIEAREKKALPLADKVAKDLVQKGGDFPPEVLREEAAQVKHRPIVIPKVAPLAPKASGTEKASHRDYYPYQLPKDAGLDYPRDDMVTQLLNLYNLKQPIDVKYKETKEGVEPSYVKQLNDLNKALFDTAKKEKNPQGKFVQVLTNKPQTVYYVAVVSRSPTADPKEFRDNVLEHAYYDPLHPLAEFRPYDAFMTRAQELIAQDLRVRILEQLKQELRFDITEEGQKTRETFDSSSDGG
jgi:hypothetical protein